MSDPEDLLKNAAELHRAGRWSEAEPLYRQFLAYQPNDPYGLHLYGVLLHQTGNSPLAIAMIQQAIRLKQDEVEFYSNLGTILNHAERYEEALAVLTTALQINPRFEEALNNLGNTYYKLGHHREAMQAYRQAIECNPNFAIGYFNLGNVLRIEGRADEAIAACQYAIQLDPRFAEAYNNLATALMEKYRYPDAIAVLERAIQIQPNYPDAWKNMGNAYTEQGRYDLALPAFERAAKLAPQSALMSYTFMKQHVADWEGLEENARSLVAMVDAPDYVRSETPLTPFGFLTLPIETSPAQQHRCAATWSRQKYRTRDARARPSQSTLERRHTVRIGYLSADYRPHATACLIRELFAAHDRNQFSIHAYSIGPYDESPVRQSIVESVDTFTDLHSLPFASAAERIRNDQIDILVDLKGYTHGCRPEIMALRPAPIQVNYLGYPGTMGADFIDYIIVDKVVAPKEHQPHYSERLVQIPGCYQANDSQIVIDSSPVTRSAHGLPENGFVYCCFNNLYKLHPRLFDVWMSILRDNPGSVLWLLEANPFAAERLRKEATKRFVEADRLVFAPRLSLPQHLARHRLADLFLDSFPVNAHTTASDCLRAGLPMVTWCGETFISRVAASLLETLGLSDLVTSSLEEYRELILRLSRVHDSLRRLRDRLKQSLLVTDLFDGRQTARKLEVAYQQMWSLYQKGEAPNGFSIDRHGNCGPLA